MIMSESQLQGRTDGMFHKDAIHAFRKYLEKCFGSAEVDNYPIKCCMMKNKKVNRELVVVGQRNNLEAFLQNTDMQKYFFVSADGHGFKAWRAGGSLVLRWWFGCGSVAVAAWWWCGGGAAVAAWWCWWCYWLWVCWWNGAWFPRAKRFEWGTDMEEIYVLYTRIGNSEMSCMMKQRQFAREKQYREEIVPEVRDTLEIPQQRKPTFQLDTSAGLVIDQVLGEGCFSVVVLAHSQKEQYAVKLLKPGWETPLNQERLRRELEIGRALHEGLLPQAQRLFVKTYRRFSLPKCGVGDVRRESHSKAPVC